jgi:methylation protein EvaC
MRCKFSGKKIIPFMSFGKMPMANAFLTKDQFKKEFFYNLDVGFSEKYYLFQVNDHPVSEKIFNDDYPFYTSKSNYMIDHFKIFADWIKKNYLNNSSKIIEIGANDGTFLKNFDIKNITHCGFEPSKKIAKIAKNKGLDMIPDFFNEKNSNNLNKFKKNTDVVCAANVICHIPDLNDLIKGIDAVLSKKGVFIFEEPYLGSMFKKVSYDQIYDAHIYIFSLLSVREIFKKYDFDLIDAYPQITHGGSMRYVIARKNERQISNKINTIINNEISLGMNSLKSCVNFKKNCEELRDKFIKRILFYKDQNKKICGYAASAKSTTVLNYCQISSNVIDFIADSTEEKIGKFSPGMHIPIKSIEYFRKNLPDIAVLFSWNHKKEIKNKESKFLKSGGKWIWHLQ